MNKKPQTPSNELLESIVRIINEQKPQTTEELMNLIAQRYNLTPREIINVCQQLESADTIHFTKNTITKPKKFILLRKTLWFWLTITLSMVTVAAVFTIPQNAYPLVYLRQILGTVFILFLPGLVLLKMLYPSKLPIPKTSSENLDTVERISLSSGLSVALAAMVGLILNYTPWGIRLTPITLSLLTLTLVFGATALLREYQSKYPSNNLNC